MTVTYSLDVATASPLNIHKLLFKWKGSLWKAVLPELIVWLIFYYVLSIVYRTAMSEEQQAIFENISEYCHNYQSYIPVTFLLGFYVSTVYARWKETFNNIGWIDNTALLLTTSLKGNNELARNIRRNVLRYIILVQTMAFRTVSPNIKRRFPTMDHFVTGGLMTENELQEFEAIKSRFTKFWVPINWAYLLLKRARELELINSDIVLIDIMNKISLFRTSVIRLTLYDWAPMPLIYVQTVNLTVRTYFIIALMARQYLLHKGATPNSKVVDMYFPFITVLQFIFTMGWLKVAEIMLNPMGDDDDDYELNWVIDRNLQVGLLIADTHGRLPEVEHDKFWEDDLPEPLYTYESIRPHEYLGSTVNLNVQPRRKFSEFLRRNKSCVIINKEKEDLKNIRAKPRKFMTTTTVDDDYDDLKTADPKKIAVVRKSTKRKKSLLEPVDFDGSFTRFMRYNKLSNVRLSHDNSDSYLVYRNSHNNDPSTINPRKYSDVTHLNPDDLHKLLEQLSKTKENENDSEEEQENNNPNLNRSQSRSSIQAWVLKELRPIVEEDECTKSAFQSTPSTTRVSSDEFKCTTIDIPNEEDKEKVSPPQETSLTERLRSLFTNPLVISKRFTVSDKESKQRRLSYDNMAYEHSAPANLDIINNTVMKKENGEQEKPKNDQTPETTSEGRPIFRLSYDSDSAPSPPDHKTD